MNLFATDPCPRLSAEALDDSRVTKMTLETAQMICTAFHGRSLKLPYRPTHQNHPVTKWVMADDRNLYWLIKHHQALAREFQMRTGNVHKSWQDVGKLVIDVIPKQRPPETFQNSAGRSSLNLDYSWVENTHTAYRMYLRARWMLSKPMWTDRGPPQWLDDGPALPGNDMFLLLDRALAAVPRGKSGEIPCPRCSSTINWSTAPGLLITLKCKTTDCLYAEEIK